MSYLSKSTNAGLLAYSITTSPDPIQVSPEQGNPSLTSLVVTVSNNTMGPIYCNKIIFSFPVGDLAQDLAAKPDGILVSSNPSAKWKISVTGSGVFTATPVKPEDNLITTGGISFQIFNIQTNKQVGTFTFDVTEESSTDNVKFSKKDNSYDLGKFPYGFYVSNFAASAPMVNHDQPVTLTWSGSDLATYTLLYDTHSVDVTNVRTYTVEHLKNITTFALKAHVVEKGEGADVYLYVTVIVANPDLVATTLKVLQASDLMATTIKSTLGVTGDTTVTKLTAKAALSVEGDTTVKSIGATTLGVTGNSNLLNLGVGGTLGVTGQATVGPIRINGPINAFGSVSMMKNATLLASGENFQAKYFTAKTDGFVVSYIGYPSNISKMSNVISQIYSSGIWFQDLGGTTGTFGAAWVSTMVANPSSMCVPVAAGSTFGYAGYQMDGNQLNSTMWFYWFPIGTAPAGESTFDLLKEEETKAISLPEPIVPFVMESHERRGINIDINIPEGNYEKGSRGK